VFSLRKRPRHLVFATILAGEYFAGTTVSDEASLTVVYSLSRSSRLGDESP